MTERPLLARVLDVLGELTRRVTELERRLDMPGAQASAPATSFEETARLVQLGRLGDIVSPRPPGRALRPPSPARARRR